MKKTFLTAAATLGLGLAPLAAHSAPVTYTVDPEHTYPYFEVNHLGFSTMRGRFNRTEGRIILDREAGTGSVDIVIDAESIDTGLKSRDDHLRSPDFLNTAEFPDLTFKSTEVRLDGDRATIQGRLTIAGAARTVTLEVESIHCGPNPMTRQQTCGFDAVTTIKRSDFGINYALPAVGDELRIAINVEALQN